MLKQVFFCILILFKYLILNTCVARFSPCPNLFQYHFDGTKWWGSLRMENVSTEQFINLKIAFLLAGNPLTNYLGEIELRKPNSFENSTLLYNIKFPLSLNVPKLISIVINNQLVCKGQPDFSVFATLIQLEHTKEITFLSKTDSSSDGKIKAKKLQSLKNQCGTVNVETDQTNQTIISWPWLVAVYANNLTSLKYICGGTIVSPKVVISAAHCFYYYQNRYLPYQILLILGRSNLHNWSEKSSITAAVENIFIHPDYDNNLSSYDADISVVILENHVNFNNFINPICIVNNEYIETFKESKGLIVGWGFLRNDSVSTIPETLTVDIVSNFECISSDTKYKTIISERNFCAKGVKLPCNGYSGTGMVLFINNRWYLKGIVSSSLPGSCNSNKFVVYTDVTKFIDWIYAFIV